MPGETEGVEVLLGWYKKGARARLERLGLDGRSAILRLEGRNILRPLVAIYDPSDDGDFSEWIEELVEVHKRAGIKFDRVDVWVPPRALEYAMDELSKVRGLGVEIVIRSTRELGSPVGEVSIESDEVPEKRSSLVRATFAPRKERKTTNQVGGGMEITQRMKNVKMTLEEGEDGLPTILREIKETIDQSLKSILEEIRRDKEADLLNRIQELERRVELLEAMIKLLGNQHVAPGAYQPVELNKPRTFKYETTTVPSPDSEIMRGQIEEGERKEGGGASREERQFNIPSTGEKAEPGPPSRAVSEDMLEEVLSNPWVEILRKKGEDVES